jgi:hypothetical protein
MIVILRCIHIDPKNMQIPRVIPSYVESTSSLIDRRSSQNKNASPPTQTSSGLRKTPSFTFLNQSSDRLASAAQSSDNLQQSNQMINSTGEITPELDMLMSLCEPEIDAPMANKSSKQPQPPKNQRPSPTKGLKRKHESVLEDEEDIEPASEALTNSLLELCKAAKFTAIPIPSNQFDDINEISREEAKEISDKILNRNGSKRMIAVVIASPEESNASNGQSRKSRRKSSSIYAGRDAMIEKWMIAKVVREANVEERRLGFTHAVHVFNGSDSQDDNFLVNLTLFGYYNLDHHRQLKPDKLGIPLDRWVGLKAVGKSKK